MFPSSDEVTAYRLALQAPPTRGDALERLYSAALPTRLALLPELMELASGTHRYTLEVQEVIATIPAEELLDRLEGLAEPAIQRYGQEAIERYLELFEEVAPALAWRLAERFSRDSDPELRFLGEQYMSENDEDRR